MPDTHHPNGQVQYGANASHGSATLNTNRRVQAGSSFPIYHWSPKARCSDIVLDGLRPSKSRDGAWTAPYICFSDSPASAWALSASMQDEHDQWGLFMAWSGDVGPIEQREDMPTRPSEFRVRNAIPADKLWFVGYRTLRPVFSFSLPTVVKEARP